MKITLCGSIKFFDKMVDIQKILEASGHSVFMPIQVPVVNYWDEDGSEKNTDLVSLISAK